MAQWMRPPLTDTQLDKLVDDADAFFQVARDIAREKRGTGGQAGDPNYSYSTVWMTNLGLSFELKLKAMSYLRRGGYRKTHELVTLYNDLDADIHYQLTSVFEQFVQNRLVPNFYDVRRGPSMEYEIPTPRFSREANKSFGELMATFDDIRLFMRRYAFEAFDPGEPWIELNPAPLARLVAEMNSLIARLRHQSSASQEDSDEASV